MKDKLPPIFLNIGFEFQRIDSPLFCFAFRPKWTMKRKK